MVRHSILNMNRYIAVVKQTAKQEILASPSHRQERRARDRVVQSYRFKIARGVGIVTDTEIGGHRLRSSLRLTLTLGHHL